MQGIGGAYADVYDHHRQRGLTHEEASAAASQAAVVSGVISAVFAAIPGAGKMVSGALSKEAAALASKEAAKAVTKEAVRGQMQTAMQAVVQAMAKRGVKITQQAAEEMASEFTEGAVQHIAAAMQNGISPAEAAASYIEGLATNLFQAGITGGAMPGGGRRPGDPAHPGPGPVPGQPGTHQPLPDTTTRGQTPQSPDGNPPGANGSVPKPASTSGPKATPVRPSWEETRAAQKTIAALKDQEGNLAPEQAAQLDAAERTVASAITYNLLQKQAVLAQRGEKLNPQEADALAQAQARLKQEAGEISDSESTSPELAGEALVAGGDAERLGTQGAKAVHGVQDDLDTFADDWAPSSGAGPDAVHIDNGSESNATSDGGRRSRDLDDGEELPYWKEYYDEVGREKEDLEPLIKSIEAHGKIIKGPAHHGITVTESNQARYIPTKDPQGRVVGHTITHGPATKKWELMEEFAHYRVTQGWKAKEIADLKAKLDKGIKMPTGRWEKMANTKAVAEEIIIKQHLLDHASSLRPADRKVLQHQITRLSRYGFSQRY